MSPLDSITMPRRPGARLFPYTTLFRSAVRLALRPRAEPRPGFPPARRRGGQGERPRSEEHTSELQSLRHIVCRLLLEKKMFTRNVTMRDIKSKNIYSRVNSKATTHRKK